MNDRREKLLEWARDLPSKSGCYLFKDQKDKVLYIGKAKNLRSRTTSYFKKGAKLPKTEILSSRTVAIDFILADTEVEAFILENNLIKKHRPKYNVLLKDDKTYPYVTVNHAEPFPRLTYQRRVKRNKNREIFGPFAYGNNIKGVMRTLTKIFRLRDCSLREFRSRKRPCLLFDMNQCSAPCVDKIGEQEYLHELQLGLNLFKGKGEKSMEVLKKRMDKASREERFEEAIAIRDALDILQSFLNSAQQKNAELHGRDSNIDTWAFSIEGMEVDLAVYTIRNGLLLGHKNFYFPLPPVSEDEEKEVADFILQYYLGEESSPPDTVVLSLDKSITDLLGQALGDLIKAKVQSPKRKFSSLMQLTHQHIVEHQKIRIKEVASIEAGLDKLKSLLNLPRRPSTLECFDVAIFQGSSPTASKVAFKAGRAQKNKYRYYHLQTRREGNNDFAMLKEALTRRLKEGNFPDIFVVDGGKGQINVFKKVLRKAEIDLPVVGITKPAKGKEKEERLFIAGQSTPYILNQDPPLLQLISKMRDEAHRFSRKLHHQAEKKRLFSS